MLPFRTPNPDLLYLVALFSVEPAAETRGLSGSLGRVAHDGDLDWHVEVVQARRAPEQCASGAALAVVYLRIPERDAPNVVYEEDVSRAFELLQGLLAPKEWTAGRPLTLNVIEASTYRGTGRSLGSAVYANVIWNAGQGSIGSDRPDWVLFEQHAELGRAVRFFTRGIAAADQRFLPDACINYARCIESLVGSTSDRVELQRQCERIGLDSSAVLRYLEETRGRYAIAHALDRVGAKGRKLKALPTSEIERKARALAKEAVEKYIKHCPEVDHSVELAKGIRYSGLPPVSTRLPLPLEVPWSVSGPWEFAAPGMMPNLMPLAQAAQRYSMSPSVLRRLVKKHMVRGFKRGSRWMVSSISVEFYKALAADSAMNHRGSIYTKIRNGAAMSGVEAPRLRELIRNKKLHGFLRSRILREAVDVNSLRHYLWQRNRQNATKALNLPRPWPRR